MKKLLIVPCPYCEIQTCLEFRFRESLWLCHKCGASIKCEKGTTSPIGGFSKSNKFNKPVGVKIQQKKGETNGKDKKESI